MAETISGGFGEPGTYDPYYTALNNRLRVDTAAQNLTAALRVNAMKNLGWMMRVTSGSVDGIIIQGTYFLDGNFSGSPFNSGSTTALSGILIVNTDGQSGGAVIQQYQESSGATRLWQRRRIPLSGTWTAWTVLALPVIGQVSWDGIDVRGAVLEEGTTYMRLASGLQLCWGSVVVTPSAANIPTAVSITFSAEFAAAPFIQVSPQTTAPGTGVTGVAGANITATTASIYLTATSTAARSAHWLAIGKWR